MPLTGMREVLGEARKNHYAVGSFNVVAMPGLHAIADAASETRSPVVLSVCEGHFPYFSFEPLSHLVSAVARQLDVPAVMHLDHGVTFSTVMKALQLGYTSVMFDRSLLSFEENVAKTRQVVEAAHALGVPVEAELGNVGGEEGTIAGGNGTLTDPEKAREFVERTDCDTLAVAIGTAHGVYRSEPKLDFARLERIRDCVEVPLVLHGATGLSDDDIRRCIELGVAKVNVYTQLNLWAVAAIRERLAREPQFGDFPTLLLDAQSAMKAGVEQYMRLLGSANRAPAPASLLRH